MTLSYFRLKFLVFSVDWGFRHTALFKHRVKLLGR